MWSIHKGMILSLKVTCSFLLRLSDNMGTDSANHYLTCIKCLKWNSRLTFPALLLLSSCRNPFIKNSPLLLHQNWWPTCKTEGLGKTGNYSCKSILPTGWDHVSKTPPAANFPYVTTYSTCDDNRERPAKALWWLTNGTWILMWACLVLLLLAWC